MPTPAFAEGIDPGALLMTGDWGTGFRLTESTLGEFTGLSLRGGAEADGMVEAKGGLSYLPGRRRSMVL